MDEWNNQKTEAKSGNGDLDSALASVFEAALSVEYQSIFYVEPDKDLSVPLRVYNQSMSGNLKPVSYKKIYGAAINSVVAPSDRKNMMLTGNPDYMREVLAHKHSFSTFYQTLVDGKMTFCEKKTIKLDPIDEVPTRLIVGYAERELEIGQRFVAQQLMIEYDNLAYWSLAEDNVRLFTTDENGEVHTFQKVYSKEYERIRDMVDPEYLNRVECIRTPENVTEILKDTNRFEITYKKNGTVNKWRRAVICCVSRDADGNPISVLLAFRTLSDVEADRYVLTEQIEDKNKELMKAKSDAENANNAKTSFLVNMSHDIRTPMNAIMGFRDLLEKHQEDPKKRRYYLQQIKDASSVLLSIINNVLEMARIEKGAVEVEKTPWNAEQLNDGIFSIFHGVMSQKQIEFTRSIDVKHPQVLCDATKLRKVFLNILSNAYKYTPAGGKIHMELKEYPSDQEGVVLYQTTISDTGIGMSKEFLPHIFDEFAREQTSTVHKIKGTGLGMPIVKRLVELMDGTITVTSEQGKGTSFVVTIPMKITDQTAEEYNSVVADTGKFKGKMILLAEDIEVNAEIACAILGEAGFSIEVAENGSRCVDMLKSMPAGYYDLVLMDIQMPIMNGYEATRTIRNLEEPEKRDIPIIAMTANAFEEDRREAYRAGMNGHVAKPIDVSQLMKELAKVL